jgi:hypothetical protein
MRARVWVLLLGATVALPLACKKDEEPPPQTPPTYQPYPAQTAPQPVAGQPAPVATQPAPVATQPVPTAAQPAPTAAPTAAGGLSQPSPMALPCTSDAACLTHRCNTQFGKCAWPCQSDNDCNPGNHCMAGACVPKMQ